MFYFETNETKMFIRKQTINKMNIKNTKIMTSASVNLCFLFSFVSFVSNKNKKNKIVNLSIFFLNFSV